MGGASAAGATAAGASAAAGAAGGSGRWVLGPGASVFAKEGRHAFMPTGSSTGRCRFALEVAGPRPTRRFCDPTADGRVLPRMQTSRI